MGFVGLGFRREARAWVYGSDLRVLRFGECGGVLFWGYRAACEHLAVLGAFFAGHHVPAVEGHKLNHLLTSGQLQT